MNKIFSIITILLLIFLGIYFQEDLRSLYDNVFFDPCSQKVTYSLGRVDSSFGLSKEDFLAAIEEAESLWEEASGKDLFEYSKNGTMAINLIYDERQEGTDQLNEIDENYQSGKEKYDALKKNYDQDLENYNALTEQRESLVTNYNQRVLAYNQEVDKWNKKSSIPSSVSNKLNSEKENLSNLINQIRSIETQISELGNKLNELGENLNSLGDRINEDVSTYNKINQTFEEEFEQGVYISSLQFKEINIYQFDNRERLVRVLTHEMGHSLGIGHLADPEDIMYSLNVGENSNITNNDLNELNQICSKNIFDRLFNKK